MFDTSYGLRVTLAKGTSFEKAIEQVSAFKSAGFGLPPGTTNLDMAGIFKKRKDSILIVPAFLSSDSVPRRMPLKWVALKRAPELRTMQRCHCERSSRGRTYRMRLSSLTLFLEF